MKTTKIKIEGMTCLNCVTHVQKALEAVAGVREVTVTLGEGATIEHQDHLQEQHLKRAIAAAGHYRAEVVAS